MRTRLLLFLTLFVYTTVTAQQWQGVGPNNGVIPESASAKSSIAIDANNIPYIAYQTNQLKFSVRKFNGTNWEFVGLENFSDGANSAEVNIMFDNNNVPYVYHTNSLSGTRFIVVKKFNGSTWEDVGNFPFSYKATGFLGLDFDSNNTPYLAFDETDNNVNQISVVKLNGANWEIVGQRMFSGASSYLGFSLDNNDTPYVTFGSFINNNAGKASVMKFNGTNWELVGSEGFSSGYSRYHNLAIDSNNNIYTAFYATGTNGGTSHVMKFNGTSWENVGEAGMSSYSEEHEFLISESDTLYIITKGSQNNHIEVRKFNGTSWEQVGDALTTLGLLPIITKNNNNILYGAYNGTNGLQVKKHEETTASIKKIQDEYISLYPNPASGSFTIVSPNIQKIDEISIFNILGKKIYNNEVGKIEVTIPTVNFASGMYLVRIESNNIIYNQKLIVKN